MASTSALSYMRRKTARYVRNVGRSVGYVAIEEIKPHSSAITQLYKDSKELSNNLKRSADIRRMQKLKNRAATTTLSASANRQKREGSTFTKNLLSDLKSGKWYNKERMDKASQDLFDMGADADNYTGVSFDFGDDDFGDALFNDGQGESGAAARRSGSTVSKAFNQVGMAASTVTAEASIRSAEFIANSNNLAARAIYDSMNYNFGQVMLGLSSIDTNIQVVQATVGDTLNTHALNSAKFYIDSTKYQQESLELLKKISMAVDTINTNTSPAPSGGARRGSKNYTMSGLLGGNRGGLLDFKALAANAKKGFKEEFIPNLLLMLGLGGDMGGSGGGIASNPIGVIATELMNRFGPGFIPKRLKRGVGNVDNVIRNFFGNALYTARGANFKNIFNQKNDLLKFLTPFFNDLKDALLPKTNFTKINTGNYNKRKVDWDGIARKSLVEVIPTQLGKILSALTGENEMRYDFEHGKWVDTHQHLRETNEARRKEKMAMGGDFVSLGQSLISRGNLGAEDKKRMNDILEEFNQGVYKYTGTSSELDYLILIDPKRRIDDTVMEIAKKYGIRNQTELINLRKLAESMNKTSIGRNAVRSYGRNMAIGKDSVGSNNRYKESLNDAMINMLVDGSYNFGNAAVAKTKQSAIGSRANWEKNKNSTGIQSIMYATDKYNHDIFFYLQGIFQYSKHVSDNLPLLISGGRGGKKQKVTGVKLPSAYKEVEIIQDESIPEPEEDKNGMRNNFDIDDNKAREAALDFDNTASEDIKQHARVRQYNMANGMHELMLDPKNTRFYDENYANAEADFQKYVNKHGNPNAGRGARKLLSKSKYGKKLLGGYDKFVDVLEAIGGSREDLESALGFMLPFSGKIKEFRKKAAENRVTQSLLDPRAVETIAGGYNGQAAKGRKVTKTGIVAVSEGELIIPSELNPYYHGVTNKAKQIRDEKRAVQQYFGNFAQGGIPGSLSLSNLIQHYMEAEGLSEKAATKKAKKFIRNYINVRDNDKNVSKGEGIVAPTDIDKAIDGAKGKVQSAINTVNDGLVNIFGPRDKKEADEEKKKLGGLIDGIMKDSGMAKSSIITGGVLGGGISLLTGAIVGPLAGAAIGAATGLITKSDKVQKALFGEDVEEDVLDDKGNKTGTKTVHKNGLLSKKISDFMTKQLPSIAKGTASGVLAGTAFFGSPILGGIVGSSIGFIKSSETAKNFLFGEKDEEGNRKGGLISKKAQDMIKKAVPNVAAGAALGLLAGPFGLAGNIIFGSALGFATSTNKFQKWLYGEEGPDGKRKGGFADKIKENLFEPISRSFRNLTSIASQQFVNLSKSLGRSAKDFLFKHVGKVLLKTTLGRKLMGAGKKLARGAFGILTAPGKALDRHLRKKALNKGYSIEGLTSEERMNLRYSGELGQTSWDPNGEGFVMDQLLMGLKDNDQRQEFLNATRDLESAGRNSENAIIAERKRVKSQLRDIFSEYGLDSKGSRKLMNEAYSMIASGQLNPNDPDDMLKIKNMILQATGNKISDTDPAYKKLMNSLSGISTDATIREDAIFNARSKINEMIDKNDALGTEQKEALKKRLTDGKYNMRDIDFIQNQLGIDIKAGESKNPIENAVENTIPNKIGELIETVTEQGKNLLDQAKDIADTVSGRKAKREKAKKEYYADLASDAMSDPEAMNELLEDMQNGEVPGMARGGRVRRTGLAAVSKGELILPRNFWGRYAEGGMPGADNPDIDSTGEDNVVRGQYGNIEENLGSKKVQDANKRKNSFFSSIASIPTGFAAMNSTLTDIKKALTTGYQEGTEKKKGLLDMLKDSFFGGAIDKVKSVIAGAINIAAPVLAGLLAGKIAVGIAQGKYDTVGEKIGYGQASHAGDTFVDSDGDYVTKDPDTGMYVKDDGTPATGTIKAVNSTTNEAMSDQFKYNFVRGIATGTGTAAGAMIKGAMKMTRSGKGVLSAVSKGAKALANSKLVTKIGGMQIIGRGAAVKDLARFKELKAAGNTAQQAMAIINKSSTATIVAEKLTSFATKLKKVPFVGKLFSKFTPYIDDICGELVEFARKKSLSSGAKVAGSVLKTAAVVVTWVLVVTDFITGTQDAEKILGIKKATAAQKFGCGLARALLRAIPFIGTFLPEKKLIQFIFKHLPGGEKLMQAQSEMQQEVDEYNEANGTNLTVDEYQTQILGQGNMFDKAGNFIKSGIANIKQSLSKSKQSSASTEETSAGGSYLGSYANGGIVGGATSLISGAVDTFNSATDLNKLPNLVTKIKEDVDKGDVKGIIRDVGKIGLGVAAGSMFPALIGPALVNAMVNKITGSTNVTKSDAGTGKFGTLFKNMEKMFDLAKDGETSAIDSMKSTVDGGMLTGIFNIVKGVAKVASVVTNPIAWLGSKLLEALGGSKESTETSASGSGFISQFDPRYRNKRLGGRSIADNGCGPATAVMAINQMNAMSGRGTSMNAAINHASRYQTMGGTDASYFADEFARNGYRASYSTNRGSMLRNIAAGRPTILMGRAGMGSKAFTPFGPNNHYVVANGMDRNGNIIISDPEQGGARSYSPSILSQVRLGIAGGASDGNNISDFDLYQMDMINMAEANAEALRQGYVGTDYSSYTVPNNTKDYPELNMSEAEVKATGSQVKKNYLLNKNYNDTAISTNSLINNAYSDSTALDTSALSKNSIYNSTAFNTNKSAMMGDSRYAVAKNKTSSRISASNTLKTLTKAGLKDYSDSSMINKSIIEALGQNASTDNSIIPSVSMTNSRYSDIISQNNTTAYDNTTSNSSEENKYSGMSLLSTITSIFGDALSKIFSNGEKSSSSSGKDKTNSNTVSGSEVSSALAAITGEDPVDYMLSLERQVYYNYGSSNPETGYSDCSAMVQWAYKKATGYNIGRSSQNQANSTYFDVVADAGGAFKYFTLDNMPANLVRNDVLLFMRDNKHTHGGIGHVGLYIGNGQYIDHGGPEGENGKGPRIKTLNGSREQGLTKVCRLKQKYVDELAAKGKYYNPQESELNSVNATNPIVYGKVGTDYPDTNVTRQIYKYFTQNGYSPAATAGIMGNMYRESRFDPSIVQKGSGHAAGIVQWESYKEKSKRWKQMSDYAASKGRNWTDLASQLEFINQEMHGNQYIGSNATVYKKASDYYNASDPMQAAYDFEKAFERGSVEAMDERKGAAQAYYDAYNSSNFSASGSGLRNSKLYNTMGNYIANRGIKSQGGPPEVHYVGSGSTPIIHKNPSYNYTASGKPIATNISGISKASNVGNSTMVDVVDKLCDIVQVLSEHVPNVTGIYEIMKAEQDSIDNAASGSSVKKPQLKNSYIPPRTKTNEQIAASLSELKAQVRQIVI